VRECAGGRALRAIARRKTECWAGGQEQCTCTGDGRERNNALAVLDLHLCSQKLVGLDVACSTHDPGIWLTRDLDELLQHELAQQRRALRAP
jgi:hypothetical protein